MKRNRIGKIIALILLNACMILSACGANSATSKPQGDFAIRDENDYDIITIDDVEMIDSYATIDVWDNSEKYAVHMKLTEDGSKKMADATTQNLDKQLYIYVDGELISSPTVVSVITDGNINIVTCDTKAEAEEMVERLYGERN